MSKKLAPAKKKSVVEHARQLAAPKTRVRLVIDMDESGNLGNYRVVQEPVIPKNWKR